MIREALDWLLGAPDHRVTLTQRASASRETLTFGLGDKIDLSDAAGKTICRVTLLGDRHLRLHFFTDEDPPFDAELAAALERWQEPAAA